MAHCSISLLGTMRIILDGSPLQGLESAKVRALLAYLVVESGQVHEREQLAGLFWPEMSEAQARHSLSQAIHNLRQALGQAGNTGGLSGQPGSGLPGGSASFLLVTPHTVQFNQLSDAWLDVEEFEQLIAQVRQHTHRRVETCASCAKILMKAAQLYQGDFMAGSFVRGCQAFEEWVLVWRERMHRMMSETLANLTSSYASRNELRTALELADRWALMDPFNEPAQRTMMRLLALSGQRTQALERYAGFSRLLVAELGVEPALETQQLYQRILTEESAQVSLPGVPGRLPLPLTPFVGREDELIELAAGLRDSQIRLVTLLGPGGCGKTHLALQTAHTLRYDFPDGLYFVSLSGLGSAEAFYPALINALGMAVQPDRGNLDEQLTMFLKRRRLLIILDSFEEALAAAPALTPLLQAAPGLQMLITSRACLNLLPEQVYSLQGLDYPDPTSLNLPDVDLKDYPALQLFANTGRRVRADFSPSAADVLQMIRICRLVNGMPLGILLAAGWLETCTPFEIAEEIERSLDFLASSWSDVPERQRSMRATLDHTWRLLSVDERQAFQNLSVFQGAFTRQAAEQVAGVSSMGLRSLADKSLLFAHPTGYHMHDLLRQYGAEKLAEDPAQTSRVRGAHSTYYLEHAAGCEAHLKSPRRSKTLLELDAEINDLQAAWKWACQQRQTSFLALSLAGLCMYYSMRVRYQEGVQTCQMGISMLPTGMENEAEAILRARLLLWCEKILVADGQVDQAYLPHREAGILLDQLEERGAEARHPRAMYWDNEKFHSRDVKIQLACHLRAIDLYQQLEDSWEQARMLWWASELAMRLGENDRAEQYLQAGLRLARQVGEPNALFGSLKTAAYFYFSRNQYEIGWQFMEEFAAFSESIEETLPRAGAFIQLGTQLLWSGRFSEGMRLIERGLTLLRPYGSNTTSVFGNLILEVGYLSIGEYARAESMFLKFIPEAEALGMAEEAIIATIMLGMAVLAQRRWRQARDYFQEGVQRYRQMQVADRLGIGLGGLSLAEAACGQLDAARKALLEALSIAAKTHSVPSMITSLPAMVYFLARQGHQQTALLAHRVALRQPMQQNSRWYADIIGDEMEAHWAALPPEQQAAIDAAAKLHDPFSVIPEVLALLA